MGKSLFDYAAENPVKEDPAAAEPSPAALSYQERQEEVERADELKRGILRQLKRGDDPQIVLYNALECIGLLTSDPDFAKSGQGILDQVYADLAQQSLLVNNREIAAERLQQLCSEYNQKMTRTINQMINRTTWMEKTLRDSLRGIEEMESQKDQL